MEESMKEIGIMENNTDKENIQINMEMLLNVNGIKEKR